MLTASDLHRHLGSALTCLIILWGIASEVSVAFQCGTKEPWNTLNSGNECINQTAFWRGMNVINMLTDLALIMFPFHVIVKLQLSVGKKIAILVFFTARSLWVLGHHDSLQD